jgi:D-3-phosphoglycerate dehydrogenase
MNKLIECDKMVRAFSWNRESMRGIELDGKTVGVIGCGNTGSAFVKKLSGFDVEVLIYDKYKKDIPLLHPRQVEVALEAIQQRADIISLHVPLTHETSCWIDRDFFKSCVRKPILISTCRGMVVVLRDLNIELEQGGISGACLDVFENEKPKTYSSDDQKIMSDLATRKNVVLSPHVAGWTVESKFKIADVLYQKLLVEVLSTHEI